jgi:hypothetical protein
VAIICVVVVGVVVVVAAAADIIVVFSTIQGCFLELSKQVEILSIGALNVAALIGYSVFVRC